MRDGVVAGSGDAADDPTGDGALGSFLLPEGFARPGLAAVLREVRVVSEVSRWAARSCNERGLTRSRAASQDGRAGPPVLLVPGFLAGDLTLSLMARTLRQRGFRTYRSGIVANVGCTLQATRLLETRLESIAERRGSRVQVVGHSLGGMLARGLAVRRPDLVSGIVTLASPMLAPAAHHLLLTWGVEGLVGLSRLGVRGVMTAECVGGECARESFEESRDPLRGDVAFTAIWSRRDGIVDWRACVDPAASSVEVTVSHLGMAADPAVADRVGAALRRHLEVDGRRGLAIA